MATVKGTSRKDKARQTRLRIIRAAQAEFLARGYHGATVDQIAKRAKVAPQTVYFVFHTKAALISAVIDTAVMGDDDPIEPENTDWWEQMQQASTAAETLRVFVAGAAPLLERAAGISEIMRAAALTDDEVRRTFLHHDGMQRAAYRQVIDAAAGKGALRAGLTPATATDLLLTLAGDGTYFLLRTERGWSEDQVTEWMSDALPRLLLDEPSSKART